MGVSFVSLMGVILKFDLHRHRDQYKRRVKKYKHSIILNADMPKQSPSNPPHAAKNSDVVYCSSRLNVVIKW